MKFARQKQEEVAVNLTPLIDVVFLLLIFFMVSSSFTKEGHLSITLPTAESAKISPVEDNEIDIVIDANGEFSINGNALIDSKLLTIKAALAKLDVDEAEVRVIISADAKTSHQAVIKAMDAAGQMGMLRISITSINPPAESQ